MTLNNNDVDDPSSYEIYRGTYAVAKDRGMYVQPSLGLPQLGYTFGYLPLLKETKVG